MPHATISNEVPRTAPCAGAGPRGATHTIATTLGLLLTLGGLDHGLFEALQGNRPTGGLLIQSIGPAQQMWTYGTEDAFTLIPNFLLSGIVSMALSLPIAAWALRRLGRKHGSTVFLTLCVLLFLSGGGVAQVAFFLLAWGVSMRIGKPAAWPQRLSTTLRGKLASAWRPCLIVFAVLSCAALEIAIAGYVPGVSDDLLRVHICWGLLAAGLAILLAAIASGRIYDAARNRREYSR